VSNLSSMTVAQLWI